MTTGRAEKHGTLAVIGAAWLGVAFVPCAEAATASPPQTVVCRGETYAAALYTVCTFDLASADVRLYWRQDDGTAYRTFAPLPRDLAAKGLDLAFAINGGMFQEDFSPVGLFVASGQVQRSLNTANAPKGVPVPNFYRKPHGIF